MVHGHIFGQGDRQVKAEGQVGVPLGKAVDLLFGLAAGLGQQNLAGLDDGGVQRGKTVTLISPFQNGLYPLELDLVGGKKLHKS